MESAPEVSPGCALRQCRLRARACARCRGESPRPGPGCRGRERWKALARGETCSPADMEMPLQREHGSPSARAAAGPASAPGLCHAHGVRQDHAATGAPRQSAQAPGRRALLGVSPSPAASRCVALGRVCHLGSTTKSCLKPLAKGLAHSRCFKNVFLFSLLK